ncbi:uncharacterized protein PGTG_02941 [Puccinia graminis f. sp. tritici CRL 75-36-700-3]|uniref:RING-type domain-containing protein n=1 Tax=Puccinia graminis f. sp. tritici (strain CRL 75-36-700-3 / race SCCL) TaxID=418459 RepID=E3JWS5_PUCGT|nr:uncharacterized protein PGTG_02941 [Puccinia graminis f. sp. tritici CRL 75-36-700-3]EFP76500.2 hypothetical protein PGTG_02941 [Puccinia graminis f. sp. tritici CRL 75-36-700-3]
MSDRQDVFMWPTCVEGHAVHRGCVDPRSIAASSCPICQAVAPSILVRQVEHQEERTPEPDRCSICLENWGDEDARITWPSCTHFFHKSCLERWRQSSVACPLCREVDQTLLENRAASEATEQQITYNTIFAPLRDEFLRRLAEDRAPANAREAEEVAHLRNFFQREDARYRN